MFSEQTAFGLLHLHCSGCQSIGTIIGPVIGGFLSKPDVSRFSSSSPTVVFARCSICQSGHPANLTFSVLWETAPIEASIISDDISFVHPCFLSLFAFYGYNRYPFLLPNLVMAVLAFVSLPLIVISAKETLMTRGNVLRERLPSR